MRFTVVPVTEIPIRRKRKPSQRKQIQQQYQDAVRNAILMKGEALIVELEPADKPLTVRNRIRRAGEALDIRDLVVRQRGNRIIAYIPHAGGEKIENT